MSELAATMESQGLSPGDIMRLVGEDEYAKAKGGGANPARASATSAAPQSGDPLAGLSRQQVREKRAEIEAEIARWAQNPSARARVGELRTLLDRIDNGQY